MNVIGSIYEDEVEVWKEKVCTHGVSHPLWMVSLTETDCSLVRLSVRLDPIAQVVCVPYSGRWMVHLAPRCLVHLLVHHTGRGSPTFLCTVLLT